MNPFSDPNLLLTRRQLFGRAGIGAAALASLLAGDRPALAQESDTPGALKALAFAPRAKRVIYLHMAGGPSHIDLFDYKPKLREYHGQELPPSIRMGQRITGMTSGQKAFPCVAPMFSFARHGQSGTWLSELLPHTARIVDDIAIIKSLNTEAINHDPAITFIQTGSQQPGRPSLGAWLSYGIGSENQNLPAYIVLVSLASNGANDQPLFSRLWGSGFLPTRHQGVRFRSASNPILYLGNPPGVDDAARRRMLDGVNELNRMEHDAIGDPEIHTRIAQYEMAYRMQTSVPDLMNLADESPATLDLYGIRNDAKQSQFARNCLLARRMAERGVRFIQLYHRGWDQHNGLPKQIRVQCEDTDQATAALVLDLKQRGMLDDTLVVWGGEFGRTTYCQGNLTVDNYGRDHHGRCFTMWLAGGGIRGGITLGETDDYCYNVVADPVHIHDLQATILRCLGIDHKQLTYRFQGRDFRLTDVHGTVVEKVLA